MSTGNRYYEIPDGSTASVKRSTSVPTSSHHGPDIAGFKADAAIPSRSNTDPKSLSRLFGGSIETQRPASRMTTVVLLRCICENRRV